MGPVSMDKIELKIETLQVIKHTLLTVGGIGPNLTQRSFN